VDPQLLTSLAPSLRLAHESTRSALLLSLMLALASVSVSERSSATENATLGVSVPLLVLSAHSAALAPLPDRGKAAGDDDARAWARVPCASNTTRPLRV
jgi:hypothetical protein